MKSAKLALIALLIVLTLILGGCYVEPTNVSTNNQNGNDLNFPRIPVRDGNSRRTGHRRAHGHPERAAHLQQRADLPADVCCRQFQHRSPHGAHLFRRQSHSDPAGHRDALAYPAGLA